MISVAPALIEFLAGLTAIESLGGNRVTAGHMPQGDAFPALTVAITDTDSNDTLDGTDDDLITESFQAVAWGRSLAEALILRDALLDDSSGLPNYTGAMGTGAAARTCEGVALGSVRAEFVADEQGGDSGFHALRLDFTIHHSPPTA